MDQFDDTGLTSLLLRYAALLAVEGQLEPAARLFGADDRWRGLRRRRIYGAWRVRVIERGFAAVRAGLDEAAFARAMDEGRAMTLRQAAAYALADTG